MTGTIAPTTVVTRSETTLDHVAGYVARYGLAVVIGWIGLMKFTSFEAHGIESLVSSSPLMSWMYDVFSVTTFSALLGVVEVGAAVLLIAKPWAARLSALGSVIAIVLFVATITFLFTAPDAFEASQGGFPMLSSSGQFLIKDVALLGVSVWTLADALRQAKTAA